MNCVSVWPECVPPLVSQLLRHDVFDCESSQFCRLFVLMSLFERFEHQPPLSGP